MFTYSFWRAHSDRHQSDATKRVIVATDLDGMLFGATAGALYEAASTIRVLNERGISLVICSTRTRSEIENLQQKVCLATPFISESGGALFIPKGYFPGWPHDYSQGAAYHVVEFGRPYGVVVDTLAATSHRLEIPVIGFGEMTIDEIAGEFGVTLAEARLAKLREYEEVFRILDDRPEVRNRLFEALDRAGLRCSSRGRFHYASTVSDKGRSLRMLLSLYEGTARRLLTFGLVNNSNDAWVLREVDIPIGLRDEAIGGAARFPVTVAATPMTNVCGSLGWSEVLSEIVGS